MEEHELQKSELKKELVLGTIILVLGITGLPSIQGNLIRLNTTNEDAYDLTSRSTLFIIGIIKDLDYTSNNAYQFRAIMLFHIAFSGWWLRGCGLYLNKNVVLTFDTKIGILNDHFICGIFILHT